MNQVTMTIYFDSTEPFMLNLKFLATGSNERDRYTLQLLDKVNKVIKWHN